MHSVSAASVSIQSGSQTSYSSDALCDVNESYLARPGQNADVSAAVQ